MKKPMWKQWGPYLLVILLTLLQWCPTLPYDMGADEGLFALQTERVMAGQLPMADFASAYLGAHLFYTVPFFLLLGKSLLVQRMGLAVLACVYNLCLYALARRLMSFGWALFATLFTSMLTMSVYPFIAANWQALVCAMLALLFTVKSFEADKDRSQTRWLILAGVLTGLAVLMKHTIGLYAGFGLFILLLLNTGIPFTENAQEESLQAESRKWAWTGKLFAVMGFIAIPAFLWMILRYHPVPTILTTYLLPVLAVLYEAGRIVLTRPAYAFGRFGRQFAVLLGSSLAVVLLYLLPYFAQGKFGQALAYATLDSGRYMGMYYHDILAESAGNEKAHILLGMFLASLIAFRRSPLVSLVLTAGWMLYGYSIMRLYPNWVQGEMAAYVQLMLWMIPMGVVLTHQEISRLLRNGPEDRAQWMGAILFIFGVFMMLNVYPVGFLHYVSFSLAPWFLWMVFQLSRFVRRSGKLAWVPVELFLAFFAVFFTGINYRVFSFYENHPIDLQAFFHNTLGGPRGGIHVADKHYQVMQPMIDFVGKVSTRRDDVYLHEQAPDIYFLTGRENPIAYDYYHFSAGGDGRDIVRDLEKHKVRYIVITESRQGNMQPALRDYIQSNFAVRTGIPPYWLALERMPEAMRIQMQARLKELRQHQGP